MSKKSQALPIDKVRWEPKYPFDLVVGYADAAARNRALGLYDRLAQGLLAEYDFQCAWWKFDHLRDPSLMSQAVDDAIKANMVVLSLSSWTSLPSAAETWVEAWADNKARGKSALVTLMEMPHPATPESCQIRSHLQQVARRARMDFFFHATEVAEARPIFTAEALVQRAVTVTPILQEILQRKSCVPRLNLN